MPAKRTKDETKGQKTMRSDGRGSLEPDALLYAASWVDRLVGWIDRLMVPWWLFYMGLFALLTLGIYIGYWVDGYSLQEISSEPLLYRVLSIYPVIILAAIHVMDRSAARSFDDFRPALGKNETETARLHYELTAMPSRQVWVATMIGVAFGLLVIFSKDYRLVLPPTVYVIVLLITVFGFIFSAVQLYHTARQLRLVSLIHSVAADINLLHFTPLYAFSRLSANTGFFFMLLSYADIAFNYETMQNPGLLVFNVLVLPLIAAACFILPIEGMHRRLVREKQHLQREVNGRLKMTIDQLYARVDAADWREMDQMNKAIDSLITTRDVIAKIPTWPWKPETSALFFSALTLPIAVFFIQMVLENLFSK